MSNFKILHIVNDEKFIDMAYRTFDEAFPKKNTCIVLGKHQKLKYIKKTPIQFVKRRNLLSVKFILYLSKFNIVIFHGLESYTRYLLILLTSKSSCLVWIGWGFDYYDSLINKGNSDVLLKPTIKDVSKKNRRSFIQCISYIKMIIHINVKKIILGKVKYFCPVIYDDYVLVKKNNPNFIPSFISWNYGNLEEDFLKGYMGTKFNGNNILVGNSATPTNNHLEIFNILGNINLKNRLIIVPLSYGVNLYRDNVIKEGDRIFFDKFKPLIDFMPMEEYVKVLASCSIAIMNHLRQQGLGNILIMIYLGAKVFVDSRNPVYSFFKKEKAYIYAIDELELEMNTTLTDEQVGYNREILKKHWSKEVILDKTRYLVEKCIKDME